MTKKDYILIAKSLLDSKPKIQDNNPFFVGAVQCWDYTVVKMTETLKQNNYKFNREEFFKACGYEE